LDLIFFNLGTFACRAASRRYVWLSRQSPLYHRRSALKPIKYQMFSLQVSNTCGLEQATVFSF